jgi:Tfp pilus assembly protein PilX
MKERIQSCNNQDGIMTVVVIMILALMTIIGLMVTRTSTTELQISTSDQIYKTTFYAAEAARGYVAINSDFYNSTNIDSTTPVNFPNAADPSAVQQLDAASSQSFNGQVAYVESNLPPRGSGFQVGKFKAHIYQMTCNGYGPRNSENSVEAGFYRIGF